METVILIHGLWMNGLALLPQQRWLARQGFAVRRYSYPSMRESMQQNAESLSRFVAATDDGIIHLAGHSLGGLVALSMLAQHPDPRVRRMVLMGSPCMGSHCASVLLHTPLAPMVGRPLREWLASPRPQLSASIEIGVLSGDRSLGLGRLIPGLPRPNDGVVSVAEAHWPGARDSVTLPVSHAGMLVSRACARQVAAFLKSGSFLHE